MQNIQCCSGPIMFTGIPVSIKGDDGITPHIGDNGNWFIEIVDTGIKAAGTNGITPIIGTNGNWFIGTTDTGVKAQGPQGIPATVSIGATTTLAAGTSATVTNTGTPTAAIFNFGIPQGASGTGSTKLEYSELRGAVGNSESLPQVVASGAKINVKEYRNQVGSFQIQPDASKTYFTISKTGKYLAIFNICVNGGPGLFNWGLYAQEKAQYMVCTGTASITATGQYDISGTDIFDVTDVTEKYNLINNSKFSVNVQGATDLQLVNTKMQYAVSGVRDTSGLSFVLIRLGDL